MTRARHGVIINVASTAAFQPTPSMAVYGATKAFVLSFTEALWQETKGTGVRVLALCPGATETEFFTRTGEEFLTRGRQTSKQVVDTALASRRQVGSQNRFRPVEHGSGTSTRLVPRWVMPSISQRLMKST